MKMMMFETDLIIQTRKHTRKKFRNVFPPFEGCSTQNTQKTDFYSEVNQ